MISLNLPCPTCGRPYPTLFVTGPVRQALVNLIAKRSPHGITCAEIFDSLYGSNDGPRSYHKAIHVLIHHANKQLRPQGYEIAVNWRGPGARYALKPRP